LNFSVVSLGCKVNQAEGEEIAGSFAAAGVVRAGRGEPADIVIINTCTVTGEADRKSRKLIHQAVKKNKTAS
jgi:threonylcarbamoyladenosine tRNA methylthiotransferase MtaB